MRSRLVPVSLILVTATSFWGSVSTVSASAKPPPASAAGTSTSATAAGVKPWVALSAGVSLNHRPDALRVGKRLHVIWSQDDAGNVSSVRTRILDASGKPASSVRPVVTGWLALVKDPKLLRDGSRLRAVFAGIRSMAPGDPYVGPAVTSTSPDGLRWSLRPGTLSKTTAAGNASDIDAINAAGAPMFAMDGFDHHVIMHRGTSTSSPASTDDFFSADVSCCPATYVRLANDRRTKQVYVAWHPLSATTRAQAGVFVQKVWPRPNGRRLHAPGSATASGRALNPGQPVALSERVGGGVWVAYRRGYPTSNTIRLWKVGTKTHWDVRSPKATVDEVALAPAPGGRLWLSWRTVGDGKLHAARTNRKVTKLGAVRTVRPPGVSGFIWNTEIEGSKGPLDVVAVAQTGGGGPKVYAVHLLPGLTVSAAPRRLDRGRVVVRVTDAGEAVRKAKVVFRGHRVYTNQLGRAVFTVGGGVPSRAYRVVATKPGYAKATTRIRVT